MGFGIEEPTHMAFSMTFDELTPPSNIKLVVDQLIDDGWEVSYDKELRKLFAKNEIVKIAPPTIIQGPPDMEYMAEKAYTAYCDGFPFPPWEELPDDNRVGWINAMKAVLS